MKKNKKEVLFIFIIFILISFIGSLSLLKKDINFQEVLEEQVELAVTIDGNYITSIPTKESGKAVSSIVCDKGAIGIWDYYNWNINIKNMKETRTRCQINFTSKYTESILNGTDPELRSGLIPVIIEDDGTVKKASLGSKWYSYEERRWANAVILNDSSEVYADGETIPESSIESYFVWIPRYRYKIFNDGNYPTQSGTLVDNKLPSRAQEIEVVFESKNTNVSNGSTVGSWLTHPAFTSFNTNGMWVGKFGTGYKGSTDTASAEKNVVEPGSVQIKPNVNSWRNIQVSNAFYTSYDYKREMNSHMMKNTEWGSVAYLQHSKYGSMASVRINNNSNYVTGYSAVNEPTCGYSMSNQDCNKYGTTEDITKPWNTATGYLASTTSNINGIYDMAGGTWEYMMGIMLDKNGKPLSGRSSKYNSGFNGGFGCPTCDSDTSGLTSLTNGKQFPTDIRYYDTYEYAEVSDRYDRRILGDATGEMGPFATVTYGSLQRQIGSWYADGSAFVFHISPWILRGSDFPTGSEAGVFLFSRDHGAAWPYVSFRVVLSF